MRQQTKIIILGGFSRSGKSSVLAELDKRGGNIISTSDTLHRTLNDLYILAGQAHYETKQTKDLPVMFGEKYYPTGRQLLIALAEEVIVKNFTREAFIVAAISKILPGRLNAIECIGGSEEDILMRHLTPKYSPVRINLHRDSQQDDRSRQLLKDAWEISNNDKIETTVNLIHQSVYEIRYI